MTEASMATDDLLIEIGTEELPPKVLPKLAEAFEQGVVAGLSGAGLGHGTSRRFATPRRLAVLIHAVSTIQPTRRQERRGPALAAAFDAQGRPTRAAEGFARSCGVEVSDLATLETNQGAWLVHTRTEPGQAAAALLPEIVKTALDALPIPKRMRWGSGSDEFSRPVRWIVLLLGEQVIPARLFGLEAGRLSRGHRFHHPEPILLTRPAEYIELLRQPGRVIVDFEQRRELIHRQIEALTQAAGGRAVVDPELLDEVTALVEWPVALLGNFEPRFLDVPAEALISTMQGNQRYFPLVDAVGNLLPHFITVANLDSRAPDQIRAGNERVIRPRFSDAEFFWNQDRKQSLASRRAALGKVIFQQQLGTLHDKTERLSRLVAAIADPADLVLVERAASLSKCDLLTDMVQEFPELQGTMGRYYALHDGEPAEVAAALEEYYQPRYAGDRIPATRTGRILALAERLDTLIGIFAIGQVPSGNKDPFALRRAALGVIRIIIEGELDLDLRQVLQQTAQGFAGAIDGLAAVEPVFGFIMERLRGYYLDQGLRVDLFEAVLATRPTRLLDFDHRMRAMDAFGQRPEAISLAAANKRIRNILRKTDETDALLPAPRRELMVEVAEQALADALEQISDPVIQLTGSGRYEPALEHLATLREPVDRFFDEVMVLAEDETLRRNRLALLARLSGLFDRIADFSRLQG